MIDKFCDYLTDMIKKEDYTVTVIPDGVAVVVK